MGACLKCGVETKKETFFCAQCQEDMSRYPVKPGTVIHLPKRQAAPEKKPGLYEEPNLKKKIAGLQKTVRFLVALVAALSVLLTILAFMLLQTLSKEPTAVPIGRNYTTVDTSNQT